MTPEDTATLGIVIPALNEADRLPALLGDLARAAISHGIVVADGGSQDGTRGVASDAGARVVRSSPGRARQMNAGAAVLRTRWLLFLHADTRLPEPSLRVLERWISTARPDASAHFAFRLDGGGLRARLVEGGQRTRESLTGLVYGDQGLVVGRDRFRALGGFADLPLFEDVDLVRRLRATGPVQRLPAPLLTSARRYLREGFVRGVARNGLLLGLYLAGVPPTRLARAYRPEPSRAAAGTLLVFARAPEAGRVKTRLAASIGDARALDVYRQLGRRVVDQVRGGPWSTVICHDPPEAERALRAWLGDDRLSFQAQDPGHLGERMAAALAGALTTGSPACLVGTDAPGVDAALVSEAFGALERADVVFGPALDGGYYLVALRSPAPALFRDIPWSTGEVLSRSVDRARTMGLRVHLLPPLRDVDTLADLEALAPSP